MKCQRTGRELNPNFKPAKLDPTRPTRAEIEAMFQAARDRAAAEHRNGAWEQAASTVDARMAGEAVRRQHSAEIQRSMDDYRDRVEQMDYDLLNMNAGM